MKGNIILLNFYNNTINAINFSKKSSLICNTNSHLFFVSLEVYNGIWYFHFYQECSITKKIICYFFHEFISPFVYRIKSILYYYGGFYLLYESVNGTLNHEFLFFETEKLYKSLYWSSITSLHVRHELNSLEEMLKENSSTLKNIETFSQDVTIPKCCICMENNVNLFFIPCGHSCCCHVCHSKMEHKQCPLCREHIRFHRVIFT